MGRPPGDGFSPNHVWLVSGQDAGPGMCTQAPPPQAALGAMCTILEISGQFPRVPALVTRETEALPLTKRTVHFSEATLPAVLPPPQRQSVQGGTGDLGAGVGPATVPRQVERTRVGGTHAHGTVLRGGPRPAPAWEAKTLVLAQTVLPCPEVTNLDPAAFTL